jgi:hypothetical protein
VAYPPHMVWTPGRRRREREAELVALDRWRVARRMLDDEVTALGEDLAELHGDTLAEELVEEAQHHYGRALEHYEQAKALVAASATADDLLGVEQVVADARYHRAAVLAVQAGEPLPDRREPCFFDPRHGPSVRDVSWAPPSGVARTVAVCAADARRLEGGQPPAVRQVRVGDRYVNVHEVDPFATVRDLADPQRGHVAAGRDTRLTDKHLAEAYARQTLNGANLPDGHGRL